jgi:thymidylate synthase (FAD)
MVNACLEITTTRDIARQILRHRSFSFQEYSQRYANAVKDLNFCTREARLQDTKNRQNSIQTENLELANEWELKQKQLIDHSNEVYNWAIANNIAKEQARAVLPEGNTISRMYMNGTLRSWVHYIELRSGNGTQKEHREVALLCAEALSEVFPLIKELTIN